MITQQLFLISGEPFVRCRALSPTEQPSGTHKPRASTCTTCAFSSNPAFSCNPAAGRRRADCTMPRRAGLCAVLTLLATLLQLPSQTDGTNQSANGTHILPAQTLGEAASTKSADTMASGAAAGAATTSTTIVTTIAALADKVPEDASSTLQVGIMCEDETGTALVSPRYRLLRAECSRCSCVAVAGGVTVLAFACQSMLANCVSTASLCRPDFCSLYVNSATFSARSYARHLLVSRLLSSHLRVRSVCTRRDESARMRRHRRHHCNDQRQDGRLL